MKVSKLSHIVKKPLKSSLERIDLKILFTSCNQIISISLKNKSYVRFGIQEKHVKL